MSVSVSEISASKIVLVYIFSNLLRDLKIAWSNLHDKLSWALKVYMFNKSYLKVLVFILIKGEDIKKHYAGGLSNNEQFYCNSLHFCTEIIDEIL